MPQGNGTGPAGQGSMTGRGMGFCAGFNSPGFANAGFGRGLGQGFGRGRRFVWRARTTQTIPIQQPTVITKEQEEQFLKQELSVLKEEIKEIEEKLKDTKKSRIKTIKK